MDDEHSGIVQMLLVGFRLMDDGTSSSLTVPFIPHGANLPTSACFVNKNSQVCESLYPSLKLVHRSDDSD